MDADALKSVPLFSSLSEEARKSLPTWITGKAKRGATVVAKSPTQLLVLSSWDVKRLRKNAPEVYGQLEDAIEQRSARNPA